MIKTNAMRILDLNKIPYQEISYDDKLTDAISIASILRYQSSF